MWDNNEEYGKAVEELERKAIAELAAAGGKDDLIRAAIRSYVEHGYAQGFTGGELVDFFCVSTPNIVENAGYTGQGAYEIVGMFDELHEAFLKGILPRKESREKAADPGWTLFEVD